MAEDLEEEIRDFGVKIHQKRLSILRPERGQKIAINEEKVFTAASTSKVQLNMIAYDLARNGELSLDENTLFRRRF